MREPRASTITDWEPYGVVPAPESPLSWSDIHDRRRQTTRRSRSARCSHAPLETVLAVPLALASASTVTYQGPLYAGSSASRVAVGYVLHRSARLVLSFLRSVPGLVWGFLFVTAVGLGPFAGALAFGVHNAGVLGKLYADFLEDTDPMTTEAVASSGATRFQAVCHGMVPQISATVASYTLYRWECTIRSATILGFVGAGGIGYYLVISIQQLQYPKLVTAIAAVFALVVTSDALASRLRAKMV
ncbi:ABC transporter permease subunit [Halostella sp. PRR32]|uniref:PhnE/PtxC family ABC transporter permease n=1 Tax=Halostella sp. PRR32 TaxID=3098147 RepID=UPI002B1D1C43|nr:ABC transporter permease subunit [Halostella sp. PRR32]